MSRVRVAAIVEGDGEVAAVPILLRRLWPALGGQYIDVLGPPIRRKRADFEKQPELERAVALAASKLKHAAGSDPGLVLLLFDCERDGAVPCQLGPQALQWATAAFYHLDITCVVANIEYETWFVAGAESLDKFIELRPGESVPSNPEQRRCGKGWIESRFRGPKYSETQDQPRMTAALDFTLTRGRSPSFDKLCREFEKRISRTG